MRLKSPEGVSEVLGILLLLFAFLIMCLLIWFLYQTDTKIIVMKEELSATNIMMILITIAITILIAIIFLGFKFFVKKK
jgi:uncharacterized membrane protein YidH (DUF202 family)